MIDLLSVGHAARDEFAGEDGWRLGGTAVYAAATAARLGARTALVTRVAATERPLLAARCAELGIELHALAATATTTFAFRMDEEGSRHLRLRARARAIRLDDVPAQLRSARAAVLATIAREVGPDLAQGLGARAKVLVAQGMLRAWDADGTVRPRPWDEAEAFLPHVSCAVVSDDDLAGDLAVAEAWSVHAPIVVTLAERGARVFAGGRATDVAGFRADRVVDPTGAGDAFAAALALGLADGRPLIEAARFANAVASFAVEAVSTEGLADRSRVDARIARG